MKVKTAILPVAGKGTRVMPLSLHQPKAMIGIVDRPMIHYLIDELIAAGIKHVILVISPDQKEFRRYFDFLRQDEEWKKIGVKISFAIQKIAKGNGHALLSAEKYIKTQETFVAAFADDIIPLRYSPVKKILELYYKYKGPVLTLEKVPKKLLSRYGIVRGVRIQERSGLYKIKNIVEKPKPQNAPSNLAITGRYILNHSIFKYIREIDKKLKNSSKEVYLTDALKLYLKNKGQVYGYLFKGKKFDAGSLIGLLQAQTYFGIRHKDFKKEFRKFLKQAK